MGDSAGANLCLQLALAARARGLAAPAALVLISPWVDLADEAMDARSWADNAHVDYLPAELVRRFARAYASADESLSSDVSPLRATVDALRDAVPRTFLTYGTCEQLYDQQRAMCERLAASGEHHSDRAPRVRRRISSLLMTLPGATRMAGVELECYEQPFMPHAAPVFAAFAYGPAPDSGPPHAACEPTPPRSVPARADDARQSCGAAPPHPAPGRTPAAPPPAPIEALNRIAAFVDSVWPHSDR